MVANSRSGLFMLFAAVALLVAGGCSKHPELAKVNEKGSSQWKLHETKLVGQPDLVILIINAGNRIDTPEGEKLLELGITCGGYGSLRISVASPVEAESGDVEVGFDGATPVQKKWDLHGFPQIHAYGINLPDDERADFVRRLRRSATFQFQFTPKGGKPQMSAFRLLDIGKQMDQKPSCTNALERLH